MGTTTDQETCRTVFASPNQNVQIIIINVYSGKVEMYEDADRQKTNV